MWFILQKQYQLKMQHERKIVVFLFLLQKPPPALQQYTYDSILKKNKHFVDDFT